MSEQSADYAPEVLGLCDFCNGVVTEEDEHGWDAEGFYHDHCVEEAEAEGVNLAVCDYYQDCGTCTFGCWQEPSCVTDTPTGGWPNPCFTPAEANRIAIRRYAYRLQRWRSWEWMRTRMDTPPIGRAES